MPLGISPEHLELHAAARRWVDAHAGPGVTRQALSAGAEALPAFWEHLPEVGWLPLAVSEGNGGEGYGTAELAVVIEELGRTVAPGPFLPTVLTALVIDRWMRPEAARPLLAGLLDGTRLGAAAVRAGVLSREWTGDGQARGKGPQDRGSGRALVVHGTVRPVLGGAMADRFLLPVVGAASGSTHSSETWCVVDRHQVTVNPLPSLDPTRPMAAVIVDGAVVAADRCLEAPAGAVLDLATVLAAAESVGNLAWCVDVAAEHARTRYQFDRPIGAFQAVKHRCADMLVALELARAVAWDAARAADAATHAPGEAALAAAVAGAIVAPATVRAAKDCIQVLGGIGYTWEHDAHLHLKRATALDQLLGGAHPWRARVAALATAGHRRSLGVDLPPEADAHRANVRAFIEELRLLDRSERSDHLADAGYLAPHWPAPWGRDAGPVEQLVIDEELRAADVHRPNLYMAAWVLPTLIAHGRPDQQQRWMAPSLRRELRWCQLFSEPGAGSDLASLTMRAEPAEAGWRLTGQKVWATLAHAAQWGICLARTDPAAPKHEGITCFLVDMSSPGIDIRPLRELTGNEMFNEVFLDSVFVPDDCVLGEVNGGWACARTTLANERVSMGSGSSFGPSVEAVLQLASDECDPGSRAALLDDVGALVAEAEALAVLGLRETLRAVAGAAAGPESSVSKLAGVEHDQRVQEIGLGLLGADATVADGPAAGWISGFLGNRALSIAGGTSDIQRNVIAERLLGLPRDP